MTASGDSEGNGTLRVQLPVDLLNRLAAEQERRLVARRKIVAAAIREWLARHEGEDA